jgi:hypothetical protein
VEPRGREGPAHDSQAALHVNGQAVTGRVRDEEPRRATGVADEAEPNWLRSQFGSRVARFGSLVALSPA